jgi:hypothetical protein
MKLSFKTILPIILISALLILLTGCFGTVPDDSPGYTSGTITGIIAAPCCSTSAEPVPDPCCIAPEYWCYYCKNTWSLQDNIKVVLTYGEEEKATVFTNEDGEYIFTNVAPGKNYVITALCPDYTDKRPLVKDVALEVVEGETFDAKITDCVSTALGLVVDYLVENSVLTPEDIVLDGVIAGIPNFYGFPEFKKLVERICEISAGCVNLFDDDFVPDYLCRAAQEIGRKVLPKLDLGCTPGYTPSGGGGTPAVVTYTLTMAVNPTEGGTTVPLIGLHSGYAQDFVENISASANAGYHFVNWTVSTGAAALAPNSASTTVVVDTNKTVTANFERDVTYTLTMAVSPSDGGITDPIIGAHPGYAANAVQAISATPATGFHFVNWTVDTGAAVVAPGSASTTVVVDTNKTVTANFEADVCNNHAPVIGNLPPATTQKVNKGHTYTYDVNATDPDAGDTLTYSLTTNPNGMTINSSTGVITWTNAQCGDRCYKLCDINVTVRVTDNSSCGPLYDEESFIVEVWQP